MQIAKTPQVRVSGLAMLAGLAISLAACGGSGGSGSSYSSPPKSTSKPATQSTGSTTIGTAKGPDGTYLTAGRRAVYLWEADSQGKSNCSGACATAWPPLAAKRAPSASGGVQASALGTITRSDGTKQVTYHGHPLYYYIGDSGSGSTSGQGSNGFGAKWWLVSPSGDAITTGTPSSGSSGSEETSNQGGSEY